jgi:folate-binding protein YgfZ
VLIHRDGEDLLVETDSILKEAVIARLERYIVADDVSLSLERPQELIHLFGSSTLETWSQFPHLSVTRLGVPGGDIHAACMSKDLPLLLDPRVVETLRIERGIPLWGAEMTEETLPPEAGLDLTHIDYDRGCYPGQEVISRLKSIGRVHRFLQRLSSQSTTPLRSSMIIKNQEGQDIGLISSASEQWDTGFWVALAILRRGSSENNHMLFALDPLTGEKSPLSIIKIPNA